MITCPILVADPVSTCKEPLGVVVLMPTLPPVKLAATVPLPIVATVVPSFTYKAIFPLDAATPLASM